MKYNRVSVLMSVYNEEKYVHEAIESILNQTFKDFDFLIINDGSTDRTSQILRSYCDPRIIIIDNHENIGLTASLNKGLKMLKGEYIARMDADDISLPRRFELQVRFLDQHREIALVGTTFCHIDNRGGLLATILVPLENEIIQKRLLERNCFCHGSIMIRRESLEKVGGYRPEANYVEDYDLFLRIAEHYKVANLKEPLYSWRLHEEAIDVTHKEEQERYACLVRQLAMERRQKVSPQFKETVKLQKKTISEKDKRRTLAEFYFSYGATCLLQNKLRQARNRFFTSLRYNPWSIRTYIYLCPTFLPAQIVGILRCWKRKLYK